MVRPDGHADGRELVLGVLGDHAVLLPVAGHPLDDRRRRSHRVGGYEAAPPHDSAQTERLRTGKQHALGGARNRLHLIREIAAIVFVRIVVRASRYLQVRVDDFVALAPKVLANDALHALEVVADDTGCSSQSRRVRHDRVAHSLGDRGQWNGHRRHAVIADRRRVGDRALIVDDPASGHDGVQVALDRQVIQREQQMDLRRQAEHWLF